MSAHSSRAVLSWQMMVVCLGQLVILCLSIVITVSAKELKTVMLHAGSHQNVHGVQVGSPVNPLSLL